MKRWICSLILLLTGIVSGAAEEEITYPRKLSCQISVEETFEVVPRPGWTVYPQRELALRFWSLLIRGPEDRFSLQLNFFCDTKDLARFDTPEKMRRALRRTMAPLLPGALETLRKSPAALRTFAPRGRFGFAMRITDAKYANRTPPAEEWKYLTSGIFRCGRDSALLFTLMTNSIDDAEYAGLLDFVASLAIPEQGEAGWKVASAADAYRIAEAEFARRYPGKSLAAQRPYSVERKGTRWIVTGNMWRLSPGGVARAEIDGESGKVLLVTHGK